MTSAGFRQTILLVFFMIFVFISSRGGIADTKWSELLAGTAISVIAAVISVYFLQDFSNKKMMDTNDIKKAIETSFPQTNKTDFVRVIRNADVGSQFWIDLIEHLDISPEPAWFVGTRLVRWRVVERYNKPLREKLLGRLNNINGKEPDDAFETNILLSHAEEAPIWINYFQEIITEIIRGKNSTKRKTLEDKYWNKVKIAVVSKDVLKYSAILCENRLIISHYTNSIDILDSPTLEINEESAVRSIYIDDLITLRNSATEIKRTLAGHY